ncbi:MAG: thermonuclease family protein [Planctomycetia bacterium]|nr:thermonuclease family protein [Planctomycetia bacterium]
MPGRYYRRRYAAPGAMGLVVLVALIIARLLSSHLEPPQEQPAPEALSEGFYTVARVVDGDTLLLANHARIRLIGSDTPETVKPDFPVEPWGPEASQFTKQFIGDKQVELRMDHERLDKYGRFLAYVYVDGKMLNEELLRAGLARARTEFHYLESMKRRFRQAETEAKKAHRGMWSVQ